LPRDFMRRPIVCSKSAPPILDSDFIDTTSATWKTDVVS
jgi:hypothetical protein